MKNHQLAALVLICTLVLVDENGGFRSTFNGAMIIGLTAMCVAPTFIDLLVRALRRLENKIREKAIRDADKTPPWGAPSSPPTGKRSPKPSNE